MLDLTTHTNLSYQAGSGNLHGIVNGTSCRQWPPRCTKNKTKIVLYEKIVIDTEVTIDRIYKTSPG